MGWAAAVGMGIQGGAAGSSALTSQIGTAMSAIASKKQYKYLQELTRVQMAHDKAIAEKNISLTQDEGMRTTELISKTAGKVEGAQKAMSAGMGIGGGSVTTANLLEDTRIQANLDKMTVRYGADLQTWKIQNDLNFKNWENQVKIDQYGYAAKAAIKSAKISGMMALFMGGGGQAASGVGSILSNAGTTQQQPTNVTNPMMNNPANRAPADYYKTQGYKVPQYLSVNS